MDIVPLTCVNLLHLHPPSPKYCLSFLFSFSFTRSLAALYYSLSLCLLLCLKMGSVFWCVLLLLLCWRCVASGAWHSTLLHFKCYVEQLAVYMHASTKAIITDQQKVYLTSCNMRWCSCVLQNSILIFFTSFTVKWIKMVLCEVFHMK